MTTAPTTTQATDVQQIGAVVEYHGTHESRHGRYITQGPCRCTRHCGGLRLIKPAGGSSLKHVHPASLHPAEHEEPDAEDTLPQHGHYAVRAYDGISRWTSTHHETLPSALQAANQLADNQYRCWVHLHHTDGSTRDVTMVDGLFR